MTVYEQAVPMRWDDIRYFLVVAQARSFNAAARRLGVDQTTVGRHIRALETRLGADLFDRRDNQLMLTPDGELALEHARQLEEIVEAFARKLRGSERRIAGEVRLNVTEGMATYWLVPRIQPFLQQHPALRVNWFISDRRFDLGREVDLTLRWTRPSEPKAVVRRLGSVGYSLFATEEYARARGMPRTLGELRQHSVLHFNSYEMNPGLAKWNDLVKQIPPAMRLDNTAVTQAVFQAGAAIALMPNYARCVDPNIVRAPLDLGISLDIWLAYHEDRRHSTRIQALVAEVVRLFEADRGLWFD